MEVLKEILFFHRENVILRSDEFESKYKHNSLKDLLNTFSSKDAEDLCKSCFGKNVNYASMASFSNLYFIFLQNGDVKGVIFTYDQHVKKPSQYDTIIGYLPKVKPRAPLYYIHDFCIIFSERGKGIGVELIDRLLLETDQQKTACCLECDPKLVNV